LTWSLAILFGFHWGNGREVGWQEEGSWLEDPLVELVFYFDPEMRR
jgi:hypothetical protein